MWLKILLPICLLSSAAFALDESDIKTGNHATTTYTISGASVVKVSSLYRYTPSVSLKGGHSWYVDSGTIVHSTINGVVISWGPNSGTGMVKILDVFGQVVGSISVTLSTTATNYNAFVTGNQIQNVQPYATPGLISCQSTTVSKQWEIGYDSYTWSSIPGAIGNNYQPAAPNVTTFYRRKTTTTFGGQTTINYSQIAVVVVNEPSISLIRTWDVQAPITQEDTVALRSLQSVKQLTHFFDGLGRQVQTVAKQAALQTNTSPADLITQSSYDIFGREDFQYSPYALSTPLNSPAAINGLYKHSAVLQQGSFYNNVLPVQYESSFYNKTEFENSPVNRILKRYTPGRNWAGSNRGIETKYWTNTQADSVRIWSVTDVQDDLGTYATSSIYNAGALYKTITVNEQGQQTIDFVDKEGRVILKKVQLNAAADDGSGSGHDGWLCTYQIYDALNNLRCIIQPNAVQVLAGNNWTLNSNLLNDLCFRYEFDSRKRNTIKKEPGRQPIYMIYDLRDRLVMAQDGNLRNGTPIKWLYTLYDELNRPITTGLWTNSTSYATHRLQAESSPSYPSLNGQTVEELTNTFYDYYKFPTGTGYPMGGDYVSVSGISTNFFPAGSSAPFAEAVEQCKATKGLVTGKRNKVIGSTMGQTYLPTLNIYDRNNRIIQVQTKDVNNGTNITTQQYNFNGNLLIKQEYQTDGLVTGNPEYFLYTRFTYDNLNRPILNEKKLNDNPWKTVAAMEYNLLGRLKTKKLGVNPDNSSQPVESLEYDYNIQGWPLGINRAYAKDSTATNHYFGMELAYDKDTTMINGILQLYSTKQYSGNIAGVLWKSTGDDFIRKYELTYDGATRLTNANFRQFTGSSFNLNSGMDFSVLGLTYDLNGNLQTMNQRSWKLGASETIDSLLYTYLPNSNQLKNVIDRSNDTATRMGDFRSSKLYMDALSNNKTTSAVDYSYDANGNLLKDMNKDLVNYNGSNGIGYNYLNLPEKLTVKKDGSSNQGTVEFVYSSDGTRLQKVVTEGTKTTVTTYSGNFQFQTSYSPPAVITSDTLQFISTEEGRIRYLPDSNNYVNDYLLRDHLSNVRMVLTEERRSMVYQVGMEVANRAYEVALFGDKVNEAVNKCCGFDSDGANQKVSLVNGNTAAGRVGPGVILKVMAGDKIKVRSFAWYLANGMDNTTDPLLPALVNSILGQLVPGIAGAGKSSAVEQISNNILQPGMENFLAQQTPASGAPRAFLNWVLLDAEQFKPVSPACGIAAVPQILSGQEKVLLQGNSGNFIDIPKNGFLYVFVSNESKGNVYFDDIRIEHVQGPLQEETHYYPFGLAMPSLSTRAFGKMENRKKFNGIEQGSEFNLNQYEALFRNADPQIGRWWQIDPKPSYAESPYSMMGNNPIRYNDPLGDTLPSGKHIYDPGGIEEYQMLTNPLYDGYDPNRTIPLTLSERLYILGHMFSLTSPTMVVPSKTVWGASAVKRGIDIEEKLGGNLPNGFKTIDRFENGVATSIKSINTSDKTYMTYGKVYSTLKGYLDKLKDFTGATRKGVVVKASSVQLKSFELAVPTTGTSISQWLEIMQAWQYAAKNGIKFTIKFVK